MVAVSRAIRSQEVDASVLFCWHCVTRGDSIFLFNKKKEKKKKSDTFGLCMHGRIGPLGTVHAAT